MNDRQANISKFTYVMSIAIENLNRGERVEKEFSQVTTFPWISVLLNTQLNQNENYRTW
jgi:hypothetical protein